MAKRRHRFSGGKGGCGTTVKMLNREQAVTKATVAERRKNIAFNSSLKHRSNRNLSREKTVMNALLGEDPLASESSDTTEEVVHDSQEGLKEEPDSGEDEEDRELIMEPIQIVHLYENLSGEKCRFPEKSKSALRNEYRKLFCIGTLCEKLSNIMSTRLSTAQQIRALRIESVQQMKALLLRLENMNSSNLAIEKYLSFDDAAQRDALEIMNIRCEELSDDIFAAYSGFSSMFDNDMAVVECDDHMSSIAKFTELHDELEANYANVCSQSKLTEVGLHYVDKVYEMIKRSTAETEECLAQIAEKNYQMSALASEHKSIYEDLGSLASVVDSVIVANFPEASKNLVSKSRSA